jgi:hypothetical protein
MTDPMVEKLRWCGTHDEEWSARRELCAERCSKWGEDDCNEKDGSCIECTYELIEKLPCPRSNCPHTEGDAS